MTKLERAESFLKAAIQCLVGELTEDEKEVKYLLEITDDKIKSFAPRKINIVEPL